MSQMAFGAILGHRSLEPLEPFEEEASSPSAALSTHRASACGLPPSVVVTQHSSSVLLSGAEERHVHLDHWVCSNVDYAWH